MACGVCACTGPTPESEKRRILIGMSNTGGGHKASAEAIKAAFQETYGDKYEVRLWEMCGQERAMESEGGREGGRAGGDGVRGGCMRLGVRALRGWIRANAADAATHRPSHVGFGSLRCLHSRTQLYACACGCQGVSSWRVVAGGGGGKRMRLELPTTRLTWHQGSRAACPSPTSRHPPAFTHRHHPPPPPIPRPLV